MIGRSHVIAALVAMLTMVAAAGDVRAQSYPNKPVRMLVGFAPAAVVSLA